MLTPEAGAAMNAFHRCWPHGVFLYPRFHFLLQFLFTVLFDVIAQLLLHNCQKICLSYTPYVSVSSQVGTEGGKWEE